MASNRQRCLLGMLLLVCQNIYGQDVSFNLTNVNIVQAAAVLQDFTGQTVVMASNVQGAVTLFSSKALNKREAMVLFTAALRAQGLTLHSDAGELKITRANSLALLTDRERDSASATRIFVLQHLGVAEVSPGVRALLSRQGVVSAKDNNTLIVSDKNSELLKITQYLMATDRAKELSPEQLECVRVLDAASALQRYLVARSNKNLQGPVLNELWRQQLHALLQALKDGTVCASVAHLATLVEQRSLVISTTELNQVTKRSASDNPVESALVQNAKLAIQSSKTVSTTDISLDNATRSELRAELEQWREAWSRRDVTAYFESYASYFFPSNELHLNTWKKNRKQALRRAVKIFVDIADLSITLSDSTHATMVFTQTYSSNSYRDVMVKSLQWVRAEGRWLITRESVVKSPELGSLDSLESTLPSSTATDVGL